MSLVEVAAVNGQVVLVIRQNGDHQQRFIAQSRREAHDLITRLCEAVSAANAQEEVRTGAVPTPKPARTRTAARKGQARGK